KELRAATNEDTAASISIADDEDDGVDLPSLASDQLLSRKAVIPNVTKPSEEFDGGLLEQTDGDEDSSSLRLYQQLYGYATQGKIDSFKDTIERKLEADEVHDPNARVRLLSRLSPHKNTFLHIAARRHCASYYGQSRDLDTANTLLREALGAENADEEEKSPLYLAAEEGFDEIVKLINKKAVEKKPEVCVNGKSPLHAAILGHRNNELLEIISSMEETFESPKDEKGRTPLHCAASIGYLEGVRFLLGRRLSDSHQMDHGGNFPIHSASSKGHIKIVKELLRHCPDSKELKNIYGENILHVAARCGKDNLVKYFLKKGEFRMLIYQKDSKGNTPLHLATMHHHPKVVYRLAWDTRTNLKLLNGSGMTALDITESTLETIASYHGRSPQVANSGGGSTDLKLPNEESIRDRLNTPLVVTTLVATMAFTAGFTMPGGNNGDAPQEGMAILLTNAMFQAFVIFNTIAMYTAILVAVYLIWAQLGDLNLVVTALRLALPLLGIALTMISLAFMAGVYMFSLHSSAKLLLDPASFVGSLIFSSAWKYGLLEVTTITKTTDLLGCATLWAFKLIIVEC
ncbi:hypothetical protein Prudu_009356, partial [Prunus dulcis]